MRLLSRQGDRLQLTEVSTPTKYAILSHTWGKKEDEVSYLDICDETWRDKVASQKLEFCLDCAERDGYAYVWIDTCCIDKRDSTELMEAINSMYKWYEQAAVCYVYLADVSSDNWEEALPRSRWFKRGWTLQEMVAPSVVQFFSSDREWLGDKISLRTQILAITMIDVHKPLENVPIVERYKWSLTRSTSRAEDTAYCVVGLLEVNMDFMYGKGVEVARDHLFDRITSEHGRRVGNGVREAFLLHKPQEQERRSTVSISQLLQSLAYPSMDSRREAIARPLPQTCQWLLEQSQYREWLDLKGKAFLWIKGKPGVGKSTLVKFADSSALEKDQDRIVQLCFYFNARAAQIDSSTLGMYRSLLHQILQRATHVQQAVLVQMARMNITKENLANWTIHSLQELMCTAIDKLTKPVRCFIDALDECPIEDVQAMVYFLRDLTISGAKLYVCFASRHYPTFTITHSIQLHIDSQHNADLARYVDVYLDLDGPEGKSLKTQVIDKANGVFLWAVLVIGLLNKDIREGSPYDPQQMLSRLPGELMNLIEQIASQKSDDDERFSRSLHWLLYAGYPLTGRQYCNLMAVEFSGLPGKVVRETHLDRVQVARFVLSSSRGLAELTKYPSDRDNVPKVQFIHESVRDFLLKHNGLRKLHPDVKGPIEYWAHDKLKLACLKLLPDPLEIDLGSGVRTTPDETVVEYACRNICMHADIATYFAPQVDFVQDFQHHFNFDGWSHMFRQSHWHMAGLGGETIPVHIFALKDCGRLIGIAHNLGMAMETSKNSPIVVAAMFRRYAAVKSLVQCGVNVDAVDEYGYTAIQRLLKEQSPDLAMIKLLLDHGATLENERPPHPSELLLKALHNNDLETAEFLLQHGVDASSRRDLGRTILFSCLDDRHLAGARLLLKYGVDTKAKDDYGDTALMYACSWNKYEAIRLLTAGLVDGVPANDLTDALLIACKTANKTTTTILLKAGADPNSKYSDGQTALMVASELRSREVIEELLLSGARADARDSDGRSALDWFQNSEYPESHYESDIYALLRQALDGCT